MHDHYSSTNLLNTSTIITLKQENEMMTFADYASEHICLDFYLQTSDSTFWP